MNKNTINSIYKWIENSNYEFSSEMFQSKNKTLFYNKIISQPFARIIKDEIYIKISFQNRSPILKFVKNIKTDKIIYFVKYLFPEKEHLDKFSINYEDLLSMVENFSDKKYFYGFKKNNFDFKKSISNYIAKNCSTTTFDQVYDDEIYDNPENDKTSSKILGKEWDYSKHWTSNDLKFKINDELIRNELYNINRELKIYSVLNFLEDNKE